MEISFDLFNMLVEFIHPTLIIVVISTFCIVRSLFATPFFQRKEKYISAFFLSIGTFLTICYLLLGEHNNTLSIASVMVAAIQGPIVGCLAWLVYEGERMIRNIITGKNKK